MADTIPDIELDYSWVDLNTATGIPVGSKMEGLNKGDETVQLVEQESQPADDFRGGKLCSTQQFSYANFFVQEGSLRVWARSFTKDRAVISVQAL